MSPDKLFLVLRLVHVLTATLWVGAAVLIAFSIAPAMRATGEAGTTVLRYLTRNQRLPYVLLVIGAVAIASGAVLFWMLGRANPGAWLHSPSGQTFLMGGCAALVAGVIGAGINIPTANRLGKVAAAVRASGSPPSATQTDDIRRLGARLRMGTLAAAGLLIAATLLMGAARYMS
jgi:uncharacterized membrane protein